MKDLEDDFELKKPKILKIINKIIPLLKDITNNVLQTPKFMVKVAKYSIKCGKLLMLILDHKSKCEVVKRQLEEKVGEVKKLKDLTKGEFVPCF